MVSIPTTEPTKLVAGDTWNWSIALSDYQSPTWELRYYLRHPHITEPKEIVATADGSGGHTILVAATDTDDYLSGRWTWRSRVTDGSTIYSVRNGIVAIMPNLADAAADFRTYNQRCLEAIEAVRENRATTDQEQWSIEGRSVSRMSPGELESSWHKFRELVAREQGLKGKHVRVRM